MIGIYLCIMFLCTTNCARSEDLFEQAHKLYCQEAYAQALQAYEQIEPKNAVIFYNMGNAAYCAQDYVAAYLYWLRAQTYGNATVYAAATKNMMQLVSQGLIAPMNVIYLWIRWLTKYIMIYMWQLLFLLAWYAIYFLLYKKKLRSCYVIVSILVLICSAIPITVVYHAGRLMGVSLQDVALYNGPNRSYYQIGQLSKGKLVLIKQVHESWLQVEADGQLGWVEKAPIAQI